MPNVEREKKSLKQIVTDNCSKCWSDYNRYILNVVWSAQMSPLLNGISIGYLLDTFYITCAGT